MDNTDLRSLWGHCSVFYHSPLKVKIHMRSFCKAGTKPVGNGRVCHHREFGVIRVTDSICSRTGLFLSWLLVNHQNQGWVSAVAPLECVAPGRREMSAGIVS